MNSLNWILNYPTSRTKLETIIIHGTSGSHFYFQRVSGGKYVIGPKGRPEVGWGILVANVQRWAEEITQPDLWSELIKNEEFLAGTRYDDLGNSPFSTVEQREISNQLQGIKEYVKKAYTLSDEQMRRIEERLDEAEDASRRIGRKDWLLLFSGTIFTLIVSDLVTPDVAQHIFTMTLHGLSQLFGVGASAIET